MLMLTFAAAAHAQTTSPAADFFMHDIFYETFLRDYYRFEETKPLRIEYWYTTWLNSGEGAEEHGDHVQLEGTIPIRDTVDVSLRYSYMPIWSETDEFTFGSNISVFHSRLLTRWTISDRIKYIVGLEYNLKGDGNEFNKASGRMISLLEGFFSYDLHAQLNVVAGARLDRYYYDIHDKPDTSFKLFGGLYAQPSIMLNWHPSEHFIVLLGIPGAGIHLALTDLIKVEARASVDKRAEIALRVKPYESTYATFRFLNIPYVDIPIQDSDEPLAKWLSYTDRSIVFEVGRELNPASLASLGFRYSPGNDVELKDKRHRDIRELESKSRFAIGVTFTVDMKALITKQ